MHMQDKTEIVRGRVQQIYPDKKVMLVKDTDGILRELYWQDVMDVVCRKQKPGYAVKVTLTKDNAEKQWITNVEFDETARKRGAYTSPEEQKLILLQSCQRTGAMIASAMMGIPNVKVDPNEKLRVTFDAIMDMIKERAIADAHAFQVEAKKP